MALGKKTGGRRPGSRNRSTLTAAQKFEERGYDPVTELVDIAAELKAAAAPPSPDAAPPTEVEIRAAEAKARSVELRIKVAGMLLPYAATKHTRVTIEPGLVGPNGEAWRPPNLIIGFLPKKPRPDDEETS